MCHCTVSGHVQKLHCLLQVAVQEETAADLNLMGSQQGVHDTTLCIHSTTAFINTILIDWASNCTKSFNHIPILTTPTHSQTHLCTYLAMSDEDDALWVGS